jgi:hypothetical protein
MSPNTRLIPLCEVSSVDTLCGAKTGRAKNPGSQSNNRPGLSNCQKCQSKSWACQGLSAATMLAIGEMGLSLPPMTIADDLNLGLAASRRMGALYCQK